MTLDVNSIYAICLAWAIVKLIKWGAILILIKGVVDHGKSRM